MYEVDGMEEVDTLQQLSRHFLHYMHGESLVIVLLNEIIE